MLQGEYTNNPNPFRSIFHVSASSDEPSLCQSRLSPEKTGHTIMDV